VCGVAMVPAGDSRNRVAGGDKRRFRRGAFIAKRGEGLHHVAISVEDLQATIEALKKTGTRFISDEIKVGADGHLYVFIHPSSAGGVLLELVMDPPSGV